MVHSASQARHAPAHAPMVYGFAAPHATSRVLSPFDRELMQQHRETTLRRLLSPILRTIGSTRCRAWDLIHGVDTCGEIPLLHLNFESEHKTPGLEYQSHHPELIRAAIARLDVPYKDYTFVDYGCGKGRVLLVAAEFPFRKILGLEFAPQLAESARRNLKTYRAKNLKCSQSEVITGDATEYELSVEPQVLYFYSPFAPNVLNQVINRIESSWQRFPRDLLVLFSGVIPMRDLGFGARPQYERLQRARYYDLYRHRS
jgi:SAM-dependent methyltransferase